MQKDKNEPLIPASTYLPELTFKAIVIGFILALILAASNAYLALKIGTTISASIPASVLALGILRFFKHSNVLESNIIQTAASAGEGIAAAIAFILPGMIVLHIWNHFSYWETTLVTLLGGILGVIFSIPLRRVMLHLPALRFPEGTAIGNVLITSTQKGSFLKYLVNGGLAGSVISFCQTGLQVIGSTVQLWGYIGKNSLLGIGIGLTPATLAAGYIIGIEVGITLLVGLVVGWIVILPFVASYLGVDHSLSAYKSAMNVWSDHLRFVGVGTMLVGGVWTLIRLINPVLQGLKTSLQVLRPSQKDRLPEILRTEKDISILWVINLTLVLSVILYILFYFLMTDFDLRPNHTSYLLFAALCTIIYVVIIGFMLATICAYFTGLIGSTNNPLSGILIIALIILSLMYAALFDVSYNSDHVAAIVILIAAVIATIASISNENLQDLKAGQMIGATPWKQQVMLAIGAVAASFIIGPVLNLLFNAYGMAGVFPRPGMDPSQMLAAPQASLLSAVVNGVLTRNLDWDMVLIGCGVAVIIIVIDEFLRRVNMSLPCLAVGLGIYLPGEITTPIILGGFISYLVKRSAAGKLKTKAAVKDQHTCHQRGVLMACGMVAGSALMGVILAIPFVIAGNSNALAIVPPQFAFFANCIGVVIVILLCLWFYRVGKFRRLNK